MIRGIYTTAGGMMASEKRLEVVANNLANLSTVGYKRDGIGFSESYERQMYTNAGSGQLIGTMGSGPSEAFRYTVFEAGSPMPTGNPLDVMVDSPRGAFAIQVDRPDGSTMTRYTRDGSFTLDDQRRIVTKAGHLVLDDSLSPITLPQGQVDIHTDGAIAVDGNTIAKLGVFDGRFVKSGPNMFSPVADATGQFKEPTPAELVNLKPQTVEASNVNAISSMVEMINLNRSYELSQKSIQKQDDLTQRLIQSLQER